MSKSVGNMRGLAEVLDEVGRDTLVMYFSGRPLPPAAGLLGASAWRRRAAPRRGSARRAGAWATASRPPTWRRCATRSSTRWPTTSTRARALAALYDWIREANRREGERRATATCARCSACSGLENLLAAEAARRPQARELAERREAARAARDFAEADRAARRAARDGLGGPRRAGRAGARPGGLTAAAREGRAARRARPAGGRAAAAAAGPRRGGAPARADRAPAGQRLRPQRGARGAARAAARAAGVGDARRPRAEDWGGAPRRASRRAEEIAARCGSDAHQGVCARGRAVSATPTRPRCSRRRTPLIVALDEVTDPQNLGRGRAARRRWRARPGSCIPERRSAEVTAGGLQGVGRRGRAPADRARAQPRRLPRRGQGGRRAGATARRPARARAYDAPDYRGGVVLVLGAEGRGLRPRVAAACDDLVVAAPARAHRIAQRERRGGGPAVRDLATTA